MTRRYFDQSDDSDRLNQLERRASASSATLSYESEIFGKHARLTYRGIDHGAIKPIALAISNPPRLIRFYRKP